MGSILALKYLANFTLKRSHFTQLFSILVRTDLQLSNIMRGMKYEYYNLLKSSFEYLNIVNFYYNIN